MLKIENMLAYGYFPQEIVQTFNTKDFGNKYHLLNLTRVKNMWTKPIVFSIPRLRNTRRKLAIPNPLNQSKLSEVIVANWHEIEIKLNKTNHSLSKPIIDNTQIRAITQKERFNAIDSNKILYSYSKKFIVKLDISRFYSTIYTHSIPWAVDTKQHAKSNAKNNTPTYADIIDKYLRNGQDGQTLGIPIGPDSSFLISELITTSMDEMFEKRLGESIGFFRYIDDYFFFTKNMEENEKVINVFNEILKEYELESNSEKMEIIPLPDSNDDEWVFDLKLMTFSDKNTMKQRSELITYIKKVSRLNKKHPNDFVVKYSLKKIANVKFSRENWGILEAFLLNVMVHETSTIPVILDIFMKYNQNGYPIAKMKLREVICDMLIYHSKYKNNFELLWLLWFSKIFKVLIKKEIIDKLLETADPLVLLMCLDLENEKVIKSTISKTRILDIIGIDFLKNEYWILAYEGILKGWINDPIILNEINNNVFYRELLINRVEFYDNKFIPNIPKFSETVIDKKDNDVRDLIEKLRVKLKKHEEKINLIHDKLNNGDKVLTILDEDKSIEIDLLDLFEKIEEEEEEYSYF